MTNIPPAAEYSYGHTIYWKPKTGSTSVTVSGCATPEQAAAAAMKSAMQLGYDPRTRWQKFRAWIARTGAVLLETGE